MSGNNQKPMTDINTAPSQKKKKNRIIFKKLSEVLKKISMQMSCQIGV